MFNFKNITLDSNNITIAIILQVCLTLKPSFFFIDLRVFKIFVAVAVFAKPENIGG